MPTESTTSTVTPAGTSPSPTRIDKPWGEELLLGRTANTVVKLLRIDPEHRLSLQYHRRKSETLILLSGEAVLTTGNDARHLIDQLLETGKHRVVDAGVLHRLSAGALGADILEVATRHLGVAEDEDIVRLADDYGRVAQ